MLDSSVSPPSLLHFGRDSSVDNCSPLTTPSSSTHHSSFSSASITSSSSSSSSALQSSHQQHTYYRKDSALLLDNNHHHLPHSTSTRSHVYNNKYYNDNDDDEHLLDDDLLFEQDCDDPIEFKFTTANTPIPRSAGSMPSPPINIADPRASSRSPQSNLTSQLQRTTGASTMQSVQQDGEQGRTRQESVTNYLGSTPFGARSIPGKDQNMRRESNVLSGSLMGGMSWGGISMGSFIRDE